mmetsp:Transcript_22477/g.33884  ORF Transcript_22477/g.33884 Transcript_22477/m.33884 type:complete len:295 (+) Transcript_22477:181-1065(+)
MPWRISLSSLMRLSVPIICRRVTPMLLKASLPCTGIISTRNSTPPSAATPTSWPSMVMPTARNMGVIHTLCSESAVMGSRSASLDISVTTSPVPTVWRAALLRFRDLRYTTAFRAVRASMPMRYSSMNMFTESTPLNTLPMANISPAYTNPQYSSWVSSSIHTRKARISCGVTSSTPFCSRLSRPVKISCRRKSRNIAFASDRCPLGFCISSSHSRSNLSASRVARQSSRMGQRCSCSSGCRAASRTSGPTHRYSSRESGPAPAPPAPGGAGSPAASVSVVFRPFLKENALIDL